VGICTACSSSAHGSGSGSAGATSAGSAATASNASGIAQADADQSTAGVTARTITISVSAPWSGVEGPIITPAFQEGTQLWADQVNAAGGINGRKIQFLKVDNQSTPQGAIAACKQVESSGAFLNIVLLGATQEEDCENSAGIPVVDEEPSYIRTSWSHVLTLIYQRSAVAAQVSFLKSRYMDAAGKKVGIIYVDDATTVNDYQALKAGMEKQGLNVVHSEGVATNQASFVPQMSRMRASGARLVALLVNGEAPGILRDAKSIGYKPEWYAAPLAVTLDAIAEASGGLLNGVRGLRTYTNSGTAAFGAYQAIAARFGGAKAAKSVGTADMATYASADVIGQILRLAGRNLTRGSFLKAAREKLDYTSPYIGGPITFNGRQVGSLSYFPIVCCNSVGDYKSLGPPASRF
jgi:branched-chain amino acid transport system substrate-binding protein